MADVAFLISEFQDMLIPVGTHRNVALPEVARKPAVVVGMRRTGKTFVLYQEMNRLIDSGVDKRDILYVNFEDDRLHPLSETLLDELLETFFAFNPGARVHGFHLFFDEIQVVPDFARFVRRVIDTLPAKVYLTGSSAKLLHTDVATEFRGRGLAVEVSPMSFEESARSAGIEWSGTEFIGPNVRAQLRGHLDRFLEVGGFPEVLDAPLQQRIQTLQDYVELVLLRDVIERHSVENSAAARAFSRLLLQSSGRRFSVNKAHADLRSRGLRVSKDTLHSLLDYFEDAFLLQTVPMFSASERVQATNLRKVYAIDQGLAWAMSHVTALDLGARLETAVYVELRRRAGRLLSGQISYHVTDSGHEVDFVVGDPFERRVTHLVQVSATISDPVTREREVRALREAMGELDTGVAEIVTINESRTIEVESGTISVVPAWEWLLRPEPSRVRSAIL